MSSENTARSDGKSLGTGIGGGIIGIIIGIIIGFLAGKSSPFQVALDLPEYPVVNNVVLTGNQAKLTVDVKTEKDAVIQLWSDVIPDAETPKERPQDSPFQAQMHAGTNVNANTTKTFTLEHGQPVTAAGDYKFVVWAQVFAYSKTDKFFTK